MEDQTTPSSTSSETDPLVRKQNIVVRTFQQAPKFSWSALAIVVVIFAAIGTHFLSGSHAASCTVNSQLVNSCRPWLGAWANLYPGHTNTGLKDQITDHENRIGRQVDMVHAYNSPGSVVTADEKYYATRPGTILLLNWKPSTVWAQAAGGNATVNAQIDSMAQSIKALAPHKIMLIVFHEPENDVSPGTSSCGNLSGNSGSPSDYVNMWHNVRARFDAAGVNNVVWGMNYMLYKGGTCLVPQLWPGNNYVDWVFADPYVSGGDPSYTDRMDFTYNWLMQNSDSAHNYASKPFGWAEWGGHEMTQDQAYQVYVGAKNALDSNRYPNLKAICIFDASAGAHGGGAVGLADNGTADPTEQQYYNKFANDPRFTDGFYQPAADTTPPTVNITSPGNNTIASKILTITGTASDDVGVTDVSMRVDNVYVSSDNTTPYTFSLDTTKYTDGNHTVTLRAWDAAGNSHDASVTVNVSNNDTTAPSVSLSSPLNGDVLAGKTIVQATASDNVSVSKVEFYIDGSLKVVRTSAPYCLGGAAGTSCNTWDSTTLADGSHTLVAKAYDPAGNNSASGITITVKNDSPTDTTPPTVSISAPTDGSRVSGKVRVAASATDNIGVTWLEVKVDNVVQASGATDSLSFQWNTSPKSVASGKHTITVTAKDAAGNMDSQSITVNK